MQVVSRKAALSAGLMYYFTGKPCKHGHTDKRLASNGTCVTCLAVWHSDHAEQERRRHKLWAKQNPDKASKWHRNNPEAYRDAVRRSNHKRRSQTEGVLSQDIYDVLMLKQEGLCVYCKADLNESGRHLDHIIPLALGGSNTDENVQLLCPTCNTSKGSAHPVEYESRIGYRRVE